MQMRRFFPALALLASFAPPVLAQTQAPATPAASQVPTADAAYYFLLGRHLEGEGQIEEAIAAHKKAIEEERLVEIGRKGSMALFRAKTFDKNLTDTEMGEIDVDLGEKEE